MTREQELEEMLSKIVNRSTRVVGTDSCGNEQVKINVELLKQAAALINVKREF